MRLLFLSNYFPPFARGGYEQWCEEVATALTCRGHHVCVLTSRHLDGERPVPSNGIEVHRLLRLEVESGLGQTGLRLLRDRRRLEHENLAHVRNIVIGFQPSVALIWGMWNVPRSVPALVEELLPQRVAYYLCDYWLSLPSAYLQQLQAPASRTLARLPKRILSQPFVSRLRSETPIRLRVQYPICVSQGLRKILVKDGVGVQHARIIHGGTEFSDTRHLSARAHSNQNVLSLRLLYAGRLTPEKGVHTAIRAMALLAHENQRQVTLDILGRGDSGYERALRALVHQYHLKKRVSFRDSVPLSAMASLLAQYDALVFPSEWEEPFARVVLEAMAAGLLVIGTLTGGTGEVLVEGETGLTFARGDAHGLRDQIQRAQSDSQLRLHLATAGRQRVAKEFALKQMVDQLEMCLQSIARDGTR